MFGRKKVIQNMRTSYLENPSYMRSSFEQGDLVTLDYADINDIPIGKVLWESHQTGRRKIDWLNKGSKEHKYHLPEETCSHIIKLSHFYRNIIDNEDYLIAKVSPVYDGEVEEEDSFYVALYNLDRFENGIVGQSVLVKDNRINMQSYEICEIIDVMSRKQYTKRVKGEVICAIDIDAYLKREDERKEHEQIKRDLMNEYGIDVKQLHKIEFQENCKPMLEQYKETSRYVL